MPRHKRGGGGNLKINFAGGNLKKIITGGKAKLTYFAGGKDLLTL
jgi:hypothetical protein